MRKLVTAKLWANTHQLLKRVQKALPGDPSLISLLDEAVKLLAEKYLPREDENAKP